VVLVMRWTRGYRSANVEDRRAFGGGGGMGAAGIGLLGWLFTRFGLPGLLIGGALLYFMGGGLGGGSETALPDPSQQRAASTSLQEEEAVQFVSFVLDDVQNSWTAAFGADGSRYPLARLVLFRGRTQSGCGAGSAMTGPFYCPADQRVYIDLGFYDELRRRFGAPGDFAQAYVIAHEIGHHVQHVLGLTDRVHGAARSERQGEDSASVRLELQADCLAGMWARSTEKRNLLEEGDIDEALTAAAAIGDDRLQKQSTGTVSPESWTHGSSEQRMRWFKRGYAQGSLDACNTFAAGVL
jgi:predicted metalloprotease